MTSLFGQGGGIFNSTSKCIVVTVAILIYNNCNWSLELTIIVIDVSLCVVWIDDDKPMTVKQFDLNEVKKLSSSLLFEVIIVSDMYWLWITTIIITDITDIIIPCIPIINTTIIPFTNTILSILSSWLLSILSSWLSSSSIIPSSSLSIVYYLF